MLTIKKLTLMGCAAALSAFLVSPQTQAATYSDAGSAVLVFPKIVVNSTTDTVVQIANQNLAAQAAAHCFYVDANSHCSNTDNVCASSSDCLDTTGLTGVCTADWREVNFDVILTPGQPLAWSASKGLTNGTPNSNCTGAGQPAGCCTGAGTGTCTGLDDFRLPCPGGLLNHCPGSNAGTRVPPVGETPFIGELKCVETDPTTRLPQACSTLDCGGDPADCCHDDLIGSATIEQLTTQKDLDPARYNAVGLRSTGFNDGDGELVIGGSGDPGPAEYQPCADVLVLNHLFDFATDPISGVPHTPPPDQPGALAQTDLTLVPCTEDFELAQVPQVTAQFLVYNEFEQRFSTSRSVDCLLDSPISLIDTTQATRSIFSAGVAGTVSGQTRITGVNGGLIGSASLSLCTSVGCSTSGYNLNQFADRVDPDFIRIP